MLPFRCYSVIVHVKMYNFNLQKVVSITFPNPHFILSNKKSFRISVS